MTGNKTKKIFHSEQSNVDRSVQVKVEHTERQKQLDKNLMHLVHLTGQVKLFSFLLHTDHSSCHQFIPVIIVLIGSNVLTDKEGQLSPFTMTGKDYRQMVTYLSRSCFPATFPTSLYSKCLCVTCSLKRYRV